MQYRNILLIDDDEDDQEIFSAAVNEVSDSVVINSMVNAKEALQKLVLKEISPDLIFLDLNMPMMNGRQFLVEIKAKSSLVHLPVIIFSTSSDAVTIRSMKELGASDFIVKPSRFDHLTTILKQVLI